MKRVLPCLIGLLGVLAEDGHSGNAPTLIIEWRSNRMVHLAWANGSDPFVLEQSSFVGDFSPWQLVTQTPTIAENQSVVTLTAVESSRFFRLRTPDLTRILQSSPANGESGVSVTRETIFRFNYPLAASTVLGPNQVHADFAGRRYLSRVELSSDRKSVTLFYLEPLPGSARMRVTFDASGLMDTFGRLVDLDGDGQPGGVAHVDFNTLSLTPLPGTGIVGTVYASEQVPGANPNSFINRPLQGVTITVDGMEQTLRTVTDASGFFRLSPCPVGDFFVHIDGRTVTDLPAGIRYPDQAYYPFVGKAWHAEPGNTNNPAGGTGLIYLPLVVAGTLQPVSATEDTMITFPPSVITKNPALAGVHIVVPANSLFSDNGTRGGKVGIAPVPPDRLPGPLAPGLELPLVITVQTDGPLNFDKPASVCFPNLPDPTTGFVPPPGSKQALLAFNHKKGKWEPMGSMTVSADGSYVCSDPGAGILWPGWYGAGTPPYGGASGPPPFCRAPDANVGARVDSSEALPAAPQFAPLGNDTPIPSPLDCNKPPIIPDKERKCRYYNSCKKRCVTITRRCKRRCEFEYVDHVKRCEREVDEKKTTWWRCMKDADEFRWRCRACRVTEERCTDVCNLVFQCDNSGRQALDSIEAEEDALFEQLQSIVLQIQALLDPFVLQSVEPPENILAQVAELLGMLDALAGGDVIALYEQSLRALELEEAAITAELGMPETNTPWYPVPYMATILRASGELLRLHGLTEAYGAYTLFVPRDGSLLHISFYDPKTRSYDLIFPPLVNPLSLLPFDLIPLDSSAGDLDQDGLLDLAEPVYGTNSAQPDSDDDGIPDGTEVAAGTDPLDGRPAITGIIATTDTPGTAVDVCTANGFAFVADSTTGVAIFNIAQGTTPLRVTQVDTPGNAQAVCLSGNFLAVADGDFGLAIVDVLDPPTARLVRQVALPRTVAVAAYGNRLFAASTLGNFVQQVTEIDLETGEVRATLPVPGFLIQDVVVQGEVLYVVLINQLIAFSLLDGEMRWMSTVPSPPGNSISGGRMRLSIGGGKALTVQPNGYNSFSLADPARPRLLYSSKLENNDLVGWRQIILTGSGPSLVPRGINISDGVSVFDLGTATDPGVFLTHISTPGPARGASLYNGLLYIATETTGLQVLNFRQPQPSSGSGPVFNVSASFPLDPPVAEANQWVRVTAEVASGVRVRNVEFSLNGAVISTRGGLPYETSFRTPALGGAGVSSFDFSVNVTDTGGKSQIATFTVVLVADGTPPRVKQVYPFGGNKTVTRLTAKFNGALDPPTLTSSTFQLLSAGTDGQLDTPDDTPITVGTVSFEGAGNLALMDFGAPLAGGLYRATLGTGIADPAGNHLEQELVWEFRVADAVFWVNPFSGNWDVPANWSTGVVPGATDHVVVFAPGNALGGAAPGELLVTIPVNASAKAKSLDMHENLQMAASQQWASLEVAEDLICHRKFTIYGGYVGKATLHLLPGSQITFGDGAGVTFDAVSVIGDMTLGGGQGLQSLTLMNGFQCQSLLMKSPMQLWLSGEQTLEAGELVFGSPGGIIVALVNSRTTLGPAVTISGLNGSIRTGTGTQVGVLINQGVIEASAPGGRITFSGEGLKNQGVLRASGGTLTLNATVTTADLGVIDAVNGTVVLGGMLDNTGATLTLDDTTGPLTLVGSTIKGGTVTQTGIGMLVFGPDPFGSGRDFLDGVTVNGNLQVVDGQTGKTLQILNGFTCNGTILIDRFGTLEFKGVQTLDAATILFGPASGTKIRLFDDATALTLGPGVVIRGQRGSIGLSRTGTLINQGLISADAASSALTVTSRNLTNDTTGVIEATAAGATLTINANVFTDNGTRRTSNGGQIIVNP